MKATCSCTAEDASPNRIQKARLAYRCTSDIVRAEDFSYFSNRSVNKASSSCLHLPG